MKCVYCQNEVAIGDPHSYRRVLGWEQKGKSQSRKGGSDIVLREAINEVACGPCITRLKLGFNAKQESLV